MGFVVYATLGHVKNASPPAPLRDLVTALFLSGHLSALRENEAN
jgi:hypothetical protein